MKRTIAAVSLLFFLAALTGVVLGQELPGGDEPVRLKKKKKPMFEDKAEPEKPAKKDDRKEENKTAAPGKEKADREDEPAEDGADEREVLERIARNLKTAEDRLANRELGDATRQVQDDVLKDIDALIKRASTPPESSQGQGQGESDDSSQDQDQGQSGQESKGKSAGKSGSPRPSGKQSGSRGGKEPFGRGQKGGLGQLTRSTVGQSKNKKCPPKSFRQDPVAGKDADRPGAGSYGPDGKPNRAADLYKDIWGHLPESLRSEMNAYFNDKQFMAKYDDLIKRYYSAIAEKGRPKNR